MSCREETSKEGVGKVPLSSYKKVPSVYENITIVYVVVVKIFLPQVVDLQSMTSAFDFDKG